MEKHVKSKLDTKRKKEILENISDECLSLSRKKFENLLENYNQYQSNTIDGEHNKFTFSLTNIWPTFYQFKSLKIDKEPDNSDLLVSLDRRKLMNEIRLKNVNDKDWLPNKSDEKFCKIEKTSEFVMIDKEKMERKVQTNKSKEKNTSLTISSLNTFEKEKINERKKEIEICCQNPIESKDPNTELQSVLNEDGLSDDLPQFYLPFSMKKSIEYETKTWVRKNPKSIENFKRLIL